MLLQHRHQALWQHRQSILIPLAVAHGQLPPLKVKILHSQPQGFHQPQAAAIQEPHNERRLSLQVLPHRPNHAFAEHHGYPLARTCPYHPFQLHLLFEQISVQKQQCSQGLVLGRRADPLLHRKMAKEGIHLGAAHLAQMAQPVKA